MSEPIHDDIDQIFAPAEAAETTRVSGVPAARFDFTPILLAIVATVLVLFLLRGHWGSDGGGDQGGDSHGHVEPVSGGFLVFVSNRQSTTQEQEMLMREMDAFDEAHGLERYKWPDDDDEPAVRTIQWAQGKGVSPPLVAYVKDGNLTRVMPWPTGEVPQAKAKLEKFLK